MENEDIKPEDIKPEDEAYVFKKLDEDLESGGISFKKLDEAEAYKPVDRITPIKEKFGASLEKVKTRASKTKDQVLASFDKVATRLKNVPAKQKKLALIALIGLVVIGVGLGISVKIYRSSDTYSYNLAENYVRAERYEEGAQVYRELISKNNDLKAKEILAFLYLDQFNSPDMAEPLLREIADLTSDSKILSRLKDIFPVITLSPDSASSEVYKDLITVELSTKAKEARILYRLVNSDYSSDFTDYNGPIQLSDGENTIHVKAVSSVGYESETQIHKYRVDIDDKFVELSDPTLAEAIKRALNKTGSGEKLRQSDLGQVESIQIVGEELLINMPQADFSNYGQEELAYFSGFGDFSRLSGLKELRLINQDLEETGHYLSALDHLETLDITYSNLTDITFIKSLSSLIHLDLSHNQIQSLNGIQALEMLETLDLKNNQISDAYHLSKLNALRSLDIRNNPIEDTSVLGTLTNIEDLKFTSTSNTDYDFMANMKNLKNLDAGNYSGNKQYVSPEGRSISALANLAHLETVSLEGAGIKSIAALKSLPKMRRLNVSYNELSQDDLHIISSLSNLEALSIANTSSNLDISPLGILGEIKYLNISNNQGIENIEALGNMKALTTLSAQRIGLQSLDALPVLGRIEYLDISHNNLSQVDLSGSGSLIYFDGTGNQISDYPKTSATNSPEVMILKNNPIEDLSALESAISSLSYLDLSGTRITDVSIFSKANQLKVLKLPNMSQLLNTSVFDDADEISIVPINISESDLATDLLDDYQENLRIN